MNGSISDDLPARQPETLVARQQAAVAHLGQLALRGVPLDALMQHAVEAVCDALDVDLCKVLEVQPDGKTLLLRTGHGWRPGYVGHATLPITPQSQAGRALLTGSPLVSNDYAADPRFPIATMLHDHGVAAGISVVIMGAAGPYGVFGAHSTRRRTFTHDDVHFVEAVANVLALAMERAHTDAALWKALLTTQDLYELSRRIGVVRTVEDVLEALLNSRLLAAAHRASLLIFDYPWEGDEPPAGIGILADYQRDPNAPTLAGMRFAMRDFSLVRHYVRGQPMVLADLLADPRVDAPLRSQMRALGSRSMLLFPLIAGSAWYGMLHLHAPEPGV